MDLRPRNREKEMGHEIFRYTAATRIERVYDSLSKRNSTVLAPKDIIDPDYLRKIRGRSVIGMNASYTGELGVNSS